MRTKAAVRAIRAGVTAFVVTTLGLSLAFASHSSPPPAGHVPGGLDDLIARHNCWTDAAPADMVGKLPGHAIVTWPQGDPVYGGAKAVHYALEHVFNHRYPNVSVHAFCR